MTGTVFKGPVQRQDMALYDGVSLNASRVDPNGGIVSGLRIGDAVDVLAVYGNGVSQTGQAIQNAVNAIAGDRCLLLTPGTWSIEDTFTIPARHSLWVMAGAVLSVASGKTLTIAGTVIRFHRTWTGGTGTVTVTGLDILQAAQYQVATVKTANYTVVQADHRSLIPVSGAFTVTLPAVTNVWNGFQVAVKNVGAGTTAVTLDGNAAETIDGFLTITLHGFGSTAEVVSDGTNWRVLNRKSTRAAQANKTGAYTVVNGDFESLVTVDATAAAITISLTASATLGNGFSFIVKKVDASANIVTIDPAAAETIDGETTLLLRGEGDEAEIVSNGTNWLVLSRVSSQSAQTAKTAAYTVVQEDKNTVLRADATTAAFTITLPAASGLGNGFTLGVKKTDSSANAITIDPNAAETVDGFTTFTLTRQNQFASIISNGTNWIFRDRNLIAIQVFTVTGTYTKTPGMMAAIVRIVGGGGGGGGAAAAAANQGAGGAGGGGGGYVEALINGASLGATEAVTIGTGGAGGAAGANNGVVGVNSTFGAHLTANGGSAGTGAASAAPVTVNVGGVSGGSGTITTGTGFVSVGGGSGFSAILSATSTFAGYGGSSVLGGSIIAAVTSGTASIAGSTGISFGGGGGGGLSTNGSAAAAGGAGAPGICVVYELG